MVRASQPGDGDPNDVGTPLTLTPDLVTLPPLGTVTFVGASDTGGPYTYSISDNNSKGSIDAATGEYAAGAIGSVDDMVLVSDGVHADVTAVVHVTAGVSVTSGTAVALAPLGSTTMTAAGGSGKGFTFAATGQGRVPPSIPRECSPRAAPPMQPSPSPPPTRSATSARSTFPVGAGVAITASAALTLGAPARHAHVLGFGRQRDGLFVLARH